MSITPILKNKNGMSNKVKQMAISKKMGESMKLWLKSDLQVSAFKSNATVRDEYLKADNTMHGADGRGEGIHGACRHDDPGGSC